jgi:hypothetical protein
MTPFLRIVDRLATATAAVLLLGGAALAIGYGSNAMFARDIAAGIDVRAIGRAPDTSWWTPALWVAGVAVVLLGAWMLLLRVRPRSVRTVDATEAGAVDLTRLAEAAAADLGRHPAVQSARSVTRTVAGRPTARIAIGVAPSLSTAQIRGLARQCGADVRRAAGPDVQFQLLVNRVPADKARPAVA